MLLALGGVLLKISRARVVSVGAATTMVLLLPMTGQANAVTVDHLAVATHAVTAPPQEARQAPPGAGASNSPGGDAAARWELRGVSRVGAHANDSLPAQKAARDEAAVGAAGYPGGGNSAERSWCSPPSRWNLCRKAAGHAEEATKQAQRWFGRYLYNKKGDAFRHCYWSGRMTVAFGGNTAKGFGDRHEDYPGNPALEKEMDNRNNSLGQLIAEYSSARGDMLAVRARCRDWAKSYNAGPLWIILRGELR